MAKRAWDKKRRMSKLALRVIGEINRGAKLYWSGNAMMIDIPTEGKFRLGKSLIKELALHARPPGR
jgi:hypothetical protein